MCYVCAGAVFVEVPFAAVMLWALLGWVVRCHAEMQ